MKLKLYFFQFILLSFLACGQNSETSNQEPNTNEESNSESPSEQVELNDFRDISSVELVNEMGIGWNLGNSFDVIARDKTEWNNPLPNENIIKAVSQFGFKTLRIPITWQFHQEATAPYTIEETYLDEVQKIVDSGLENKMHVIINVHHDDEWIIPTMAQTEAVKERLNALWSQLAGRFKTYGDSLLFETLNEPRLKGSPEEWIGGTPEGRNALNEFNKTSLDAIRNTGGNNTKRHIMIPTYAASTYPEVMNDLIVPNDDPNVIISMHTYFPWPFAGLAEVNWGTEEDKVNLEAEFDKIAEKWLVNEGRAVILGEWGTISENSMAERIDYADFYVSEAIERGLLPVVWDDGGNFKLFDRHALTWTNRELAETIIQAAAN